MLLILLGLVPLSIAQSEANPCGERGQRCCKLSDLNDDSPYIRDQARTKKLRFCLDEYSDVCDPETDTCVDEAILPCGREGERCCNLKSDVKGDYPDVIQCFDKGYSYYSDVDLYCDFTDNLCKQFRDLPCGQPGIPCCKEDTFNSSEDDEFLGKYNIYSRECRQSFCTNGTCEKCNAVGDKCCESNNRGSSQDPFCLNLLCVKGKCEACGEEGQSCCDESRQNTVSSDYFDYYIEPCNKINLDCIGGKCVTCGLVGNPCCAGICQERDTICAAGVCKACGNKGQVCCEDNQCTDPWLACISGKCVCGGKGQSCCGEGLCNSDLACDKDDVCKEKGVVTECGSKDKNCCANDKCGKGLTCDSSKKCKPCGGKSQVCCASGQKCKNGFSCKGNKCQPCGRKNQKCCPGKKCIKSGLSCNSTGQCT